MLEATQVTKLFNGVEAVQRVSLRVEPGQILGLVGASGSGKSTLLSMLAGLTDLDAGTVQLNGKRIPGPLEVLIPGHTAIRLVHQEYQLMPNVSIRENIAYALRFYDPAYRDFRVNTLLALCRLEPVQNRLPRHVSGGEKQRAAIARAVAEKPAVLLLDEPFSHLDLPNRTIIRDLLLDLVEKDHSAGRPPSLCVFVTHDSTDALSVATTLGILQDGKLIQLGPPREVYRQPLTGYAAQLTGAVNILKTKQLPALGLRASVHPDALCCLRPEQIQLSPDGTPVVVRTVFFKGSYSEIEVAVTRTLRLRLYTTRDDLRPGQRTGIVVPETALWWLKG